MSAILDRLRKIDILKSTCSAGEKATEGSCGRMASRDSLVDQKHFTETKDWNKVEVRFAVVCLTSMKSRKSRARVFDQLQ